MDDVPLQLLHRVSIMSRWGVAACDRARIHPEYCRVWLYDPAMAYCMPSTPHSGPLYRALPARCEVGAARCRCRLPIEALQEAPPIQLPMPHCSPPWRIAGTQLPPAAAMLLLTPQGRRQRRRCRRRRPPTEPLQRCLAACSIRMVNGGRLRATWAHAAPEPQAWRCSEFSPQQRVPRKLPRHAAMRSLSSSDACAAVAVVPARWVLLPPLAAAATAHTAAPGRKGCCRRAIA